MPEGGECCVVEVPDARKGAIIAVAMNVDLDTKELNKKLSKELHAISMPKRYFVFEELPKMGSGKIDFRTTTEMVIAALRKESTAAEEKKKTKEKTKNQTADK